jgi:hypothetical protein
MYNSTFANGEVEDWLLLKILNAPGNILMGSKQANGNLLKWKNTYDLKVANYVIEQSNDNTTWNQLGNVYPLPGDNSSTQYSYTDIHPLGKENYYRIKLIYADNSYQYSNTVLLFDKKDLKSIIVYPNPAKNTLNIHTINAAFIKLKIMDVTGRFEKTQEINTVNTSVDISNLAPGTHLIKFITQDGEEEVQRFVKIK